MESIKKIIARQEQFFASHETLDTGFRKIKLKELKNAVAKYESEVLEALSSDLGKSNFEAYSTEVGLVYREISLFAKKLRKWSRPRKTRTPLFAFPSRSYVAPKPFGKVLVIVPFNYPFLLAMVPLASAIAAGNTVVLKPSEKAPATEKALQKIIGEVFDEGHVSLVSGGAEVSEVLLENRWNLIFFTGSTRVGKRVLEKAAKHLTPVILELGGKCPAIVDEDANLEIAAKRIVWGKYINAGQTCVAPDYVLVHHSVKDKLVGEMVRCIREFYTENPETSPDYPRMVSSENVSRLREMMAGSTVFAGGKADPYKRYLEPSVAEATWDSPLMQDELFGPVLPVLPFGSLDETIGRVNNMERPLALYYFSENRAKQKKVLRETYSGGAAINDVLLHFANNNLPFGGVGNSGMGIYHGKAGFEAFSHQRAVIKTTTQIDLPLRYPPSKKSVYKLLKILQK